MKIEKRIKIQKRLKEAIMAYYATKEMFPADIAGLIMSYMGHNQERWAKYWKDQFIKCMKSEFKILELDTNITSDVLGYVVLSEKNDIIASMIHQKYKFINGMEFELTQIMNNNACHKYALSKLFSRIFINNENILSFNKPLIL